MPAERSSSVTEGIVEQLTVGSKEQQRLREELRRVYQLWGEARSLLKRCDGVFYEMQGIDRRSDRPEPDDPATLRREILSHMVNR